VEPESIPWACTVCIVEVCIFNLTFDPGTILIRRKEKLALAAQRIAGMMCTVCAPQDISVSIRILKERTDRCIKTRLAVLIMSAKL